MSDNMYHFVYQSTNLVNNMFYIGVHSTNNLEDNYLGSGNYIGRAIKKYGSDLFIRDILYFCECREHAFHIEKEIVTKKFLRDNPLCYNLCGGGRGSSCHSDETRQKISETMKGRTKTKEHLAKISKSLTGKKLSEDHRKKCARGRKGKDPWNKGMKMSESFCNKVSNSLTGLKQSEETKKKRNESLTGLKRSEETKKKISEAAKGRKMSDEFKENRRQYMTGRKRGPYKKRNVVQG